MKASLQGSFLVIIALCGLLAVVGCEEDFVADPPFGGLTDTTYLDEDNWYYIGAQPQVSERGVSLFPFSYRMFSSSFEGFLATTPTRVYQIEENADLTRRVLLLDSEKAPGDTLFKYSDFHYFLVIDKRPSPQVNGPVWYILRRSRIGMKTQRERSLWVMSPDHGILAVANFDIDMLSGQVTLDMVGEPEYFTDPDLIRRIKYYDNNHTWRIDRDKGVIYEFDKLRSVIKSRNFREGEDLYSYRFAHTNTRDLTDFRIELGQDMVKLVAGDSCFYFTEELELLRSGNCGL
ncbi:MAG: hypothetical protein D6722_08070 [Bacteroidetes bacterium]|nr:MAG: hypothetical protein D6722_08070 [Bacteroidota bacterium]